MWSHYASKHSGICIEFNLEKPASFPHKLTSKRLPDEEKFKQAHSEWELKELIFWDSIYPVLYTDEQPFINFFEFSPVFENEHDCDLIGQSKSWTFQFSNRLSDCFSVKTKAWEYEKEWRMINVNFKETEHPENRIQYYPIEIITAIYFGARTPLVVKERIYKILNQKSEKIEYFDCFLNGTNQLSFKSWEYSWEE